MKNLMLQPTHLAFVLAPFLALGCAQDRLTVDEVTETTVNASGGQALSAAGELTLDFPSGLLTESSVVKIATDRTPRTDATFASPAFNLTIVPAVATFDPPVKITINTAGKGGPAIIVNVDGDKPLEIEGSTYDPATTTVVAHLTHFSRYAAATMQSPQCPATAPSGTCSTAGLRCEYGQECCCGTCHPAQVWMCDGQNWSGLNTDACLGAAITCPDAGTPSCPTEPPSGTESCASVGQTCEYGQECCCGNCYPALVYMCTAGGWAGHNTDACLSPQCPDAG